MAAAVMARSGVSRSRSDAWLGRSSIQSRRPGSCSTAGSAAKSCLARAHPARVIRRSIAHSCSRWAISMLPAKRAGLSPYRERPSRTCPAASMTSTIASQRPPESTLMPEMVNNLGNRTAGIRQTIPRRSPSTRRIRRYASLLLPELDSSVLTNRLFCESPGGFQQAVSCPRGRASGCTRRVGRAPVSQPGVVSSSPLG